MAGVTGDILALLDKIPIWKRVQETPARVDELEKKIAALEARLARAPGEACPKCGALAMRLTETGREMGSFPMTRRTDTWTCEDCGHSEGRTQMMVKV